MLVSHLEMVEVVDLHLGLETALIIQRLRLQKIILTRLDLDLPILAVVTYKIQRRILASPIRIRHLVLAIRGHLQCLQRDINSS